MKPIPYKLTRWKQLFFTIWGGQAASLLGSALVDFALIWYMTTTTGSATILTTATLVSMLPRIFLGPILGSIVDRGNRRLLIIALVPQDTFWLAIVGFLWAGIMMVFMNGPIQVLFQSRIAPEMQGRVLALLDSLGKIVAPLALLIAGPLTDWLNVQFWFFLAGGGLVVVGLAAFNIPTLMKFEENGPARELLETVS